MPVISSRQFSSVVVVVRTASRAAIVGQIITQTETSRERASERALPFYSLRPVRSARALKPVHPCASVGRDDWWRREATCFDPKKV